MFPKELLECARYIKNLQDTDLLGADFSTSQNSICASRALSEGKVINDFDLLRSRSGVGVSPNKKSVFAGKIVWKKKKLGDVTLPSDFSKS